METRRMEQRYWEYIRGLEAELWGSPMPESSKAILHQKKVILRRLRHLSPEEKGAQNRWVALAQVLGKPGYGDPHFNPEREVLLAAKRLLLTRLAVLHWACVGLLLVSLMAAISLLAAGDD